jgi:hypothetical protein
MTKIFVASLLFAAAACAETDTQSVNCLDGKCDASGDSCSDPHYGDGTCNLHLACAAPDIDCFKTFADDASAATWFADFEKALAAEQLRAPRTIVAESDPRFQKARDLLDRGWEAFRKVRPVGDLRDARPALVVIEDPGVNAFVIPDIATGLSAFSVTVQTGLLDRESTDDGRLGVMMHELQHAVGLHLIQNNKESFRRFYTVKFAEPVGRDQVDDPVARKAGMAWRTAAADVGAFSQSELGGMSLGGDFESIFKALVITGDQHDHAACAHAIQLIDALRNDLSHAVDPLDVRLHTDLTTVPPRVNAALNALRDECLPAFTKSFVEVYAALNGKTPAEVDAVISAHDKALITGKHVVDALAALIADRRATMRAAELDYLHTTHHLFTDLRYFSTEEDADDTSVAVLRGAHLDPEGEGKWLVPALLPPEAAARCNAILASNKTPDYGGDLGDEHHATCWRAAHIHKIAQRLASSARTVGEVSPAAPAQITEDEAVELPRPFALPPRLADQVMY